MKCSHLDLAVNFEFRACRKNIKINRQMAGLISRAYKRTDHIFSEKNLNYCT